MYPVSITSGGVHIFVIVSGPKTPCVFDVKSVESGPTHAHPSRVICTLSVTIIRRTGERVYSYFLCAPLWLTGAHCCSVAGSCCNNFIYQYYNAIISADEGYTDGTWNKPHRKPLDISHLWYFTNRMPVSASSVGRTFRATQQTHPPPGDGISVSLTKSYTTAQKPNSTSWQSTSKTTTPQISHHNASGKNLVNLTRRQKGQSELVKSDISETSHPHP